MPNTLITMFQAGQDKLSAFYFFLIVSLAMLVAVVLFTDAHRLVPITYANQGAGRGVQGSLPIRLNQAGMIPIIFAVSMLLFPNLIAQFVARARSEWLAAAGRWVNLTLQNQGVYGVLYFLLVVGFLHFNPDE
jgi:preprotein translocase subunit SecY